MTQKPPASPRRPSSLVARALACAAAFTAACVVSPPSAFALQPDQIALVVNNKEPEGAKLAEFYAQQRGIPAGRVIALDLPTGDEVSYEKYDGEVVPAVRKFLRDHGLEDKVTCLVTFYGVPLRVGRRLAPPIENEELRGINGEWDKALASARAAVASLESLAKQSEPNFKPPNQDNANGLPARADAAVASLLRSLPADADANRRSQAFTQMVAQVEALYGSMATVQRLSQPAYASLAPRPLTDQQVGEARGRFKRMVDEINALGPNVHNADNRPRVRAIARDNLGQFEYLKVLNEQKLRLTTDETQAAFDSELAALWWPDGYLRFRWQMSPLYYKLRFPAGSGGAPSAALEPATRPAAPAAAQQLPRTLMVMRLDAPKPEQVRELIATCLRVEREGLKGRVALDARGRRPGSGDAYGTYDQGIRDLAGLVRDKTRLEVQLDDHDALFPPTRDVKDVALYCGWYSLRKYVPGMTFNPGAVGFHIASLELLSLHTHTETGWCRGLMNDGVVGTLGAVAEPYLHSFPAADDFFPLLLTGRLTLAEVYWLTNPMVSWMNACVGDPLYTPYKANPAMRHQDVPPRVHTIFE